MGMGGYITDKITCKSSFISTNYQHNEQNGTKWAGRGGRGGGGGGKYITEKNDIYIHKSSLIVIPTSYHHNQQNRTNWGVSGWGGTNTLQKK